MKLGTLLPIVLLLSLPFVLAASTDMIKDFVATLRQGDRNYLIVVGGSNDARDVRAAVDLGNFIRPGFANYKLDSEFSPAFPEEYLVVVGGPCANELWARYSSFTCANWPWADAKAVIELKETAGKTILLMAGTTGDDTESVAETMLTTYLTDPVFQEGHAIIPYTDAEKERVRSGIYLCGNARCDMGETYQECPTDCADPSDPLR